MTFFPHLIAGPIVHYRNLIEQFRSTNNRRRSFDVALGLSTFVVGLFKKAVLADAIAGFASPVFDSVLPRGAAISLIPAWGAALAYTLQLYFDFSGYSDMAIGLARMFGIRFPRNFDSPYKSRSIIEFWRRWHITLSEFLRDYLYIPLGGNRRGPARRYANLFLTMLLGGLWHGAGWTFVVWGGLHGACLIVNHLWLKALPRDPARRPSWPGAIASQALTFLIVVVGWVFFRAHTCGQALRLLRAMSGADGVSLPLLLVPRLGSVASTLAHAGIRFEPFDLSYWGGVWEIAWLALGLSIALFLPNTQQVFTDITDAPPRTAGLWSRFLWKPNRSWAFMTGSAFTAAVITIIIKNASEFLYFNF